MRAKISISSASYIVETDKNTSRLGVKPSYMHMHVCMYKCTRQSDGK